MKLADFQKKTADRIVEVYKNKQQRVLLADEVGLGKTIVAREVIRQVSKWHSDEGDKHFKVVYICSNISIASQNAKKLGIKEQLKVSESRLSMQHLKIYENAGFEHAYEQLIPLTPATSFSMTAGCGNQSERALMYAHLWRLPAFEGYKEKLSRFLAYEAVANWQSNVDYYETAVNKCDNNGSDYLREMAAAITEKLEEQPELVAAVKSNCDSTDKDRMRKSVPLINRLRMVFAEISLDKLDPDLVIMDEFQRFRDLIAPPKESEEKLLSQKFLQDTKTKVLLLSATPYKQYSTLEEIAQDDSADHYHEFMEVMDFLFYDKEKQNQFKTVWHDYSSSLCELQSDSLTVFIAQKNRAENALYQGICRTERLNAGIPDDKEETDDAEKKDERSRKNDLDITTGDILSYDAMQSLLDEIGHLAPKAVRWRNVPADYVKSAPYLLSFMESYQLKKQILQFCKDHPDFALRDHVQEKYLLIKRAQIHYYRPIPSNNAKLVKLKEILLGKEERNKNIPGPEALLWIPASRPYYSTGSVFDQNRDFSKILVFSSWEMVPRMIATMISYEAERLTIGKLFNSTREHRGRGYIATKEERRFGMSRLKNETEDIICLTSELLASLYRPEDHIGTDLRILQRQIEQKLQPYIDKLRQEKNLSYSPRTSASELMECIKALDGDSSANPKMIPREAAELMTLMAIGSPAICAYRLLKHSIGDNKETCAEYAGEIAKDVFVSLFNKAESAAVLDLLYGQKRDDAYYENVFRYCAEGNLQAVLDEFAHVLNETGKELKNDMIESLIDTATLPIDTQESFPDSPKYKVNMRCHMAVGYYNAKVSDNAVARVDRVRKAFNSPFRPFVLATTSIGQEGLDFHCYCRKVMHWNLPSNPIDLEQREGRINRYKCLAIRQNIAKRYGNAPTWEEMFEKAADELKGDYPDLVPYWCLPNMDNDSVKIEQIVPMYPFSQDHNRYERIMKILKLYRLTLGQPRQEEMISLLGNRHIDENDSRLFMNLSPFYH